MDTKDDVINALKRFRRNPVGGSRLGRKGRKSIAEMAPFNPED